MSSVDAPVPLAEAGEPKGPSFPLQAFLGFTISRGAGTAECVMEIGEQHMNPHGVAHGGVVSTMQDTAMGAAVSSVIPEGAICATIEMHTRFHGAITAGPLRCEASVTSPGRRIVHAEAKTFGPNGRLVASSTSSFAVIAPG